MASGRPKFTIPFSSGSTQQSLDTSFSSGMNTPGDLPSSAGRKRSHIETEEGYFPIQAQPIQEDRKQEEGLESENKDITSQGFGTKDPRQTTSSEKEKELTQTMNSPQDDVSLPEIPRLRGPKSLRLDLETISIAVNDASSDDVVLTAVATPECRPEDSVDEFTRQIGVGWSALPNADSDIQAAARGWVKYIENHFPISNVKIRLQSKGLRSYLIEAKEGYFLFGEDLKQGRLLSVHPDKVCQNLQGAVPLFEGEVVMQASSIPLSHTELSSTSEARFFESNNTASSAEVMNYTRSKNNLAETTFETKMDIS